MVRTTLSHCQQWLTLHAGFSEDAGYGWTFRVEHFGEPMILELRHQGNLIMTLERGNGFPKVRFPAKFAATYDGINIRFFRVHPKLELLESSMLEDCALLNAECYPTWSETKPKPLAA